MSAFSRPRRGRRQNLVNPVLVLVAVCFIGLLSFFQPPPARAASRAAEAPPLNEQEAWVLKQVKEGRKADLKAQFGEDDPRQRLSAAFLKRLLTGNFKNFRIAPQGVNLSHAVITDGPLDLKYLDLDYPLALTHCLFADQVIFDQSHCTKDLSVAGSTFLQEARFRGLKVDGSFICDHAIFTGGAVFTDAKIGEKFLGDEAQFRSPTQKADFRTMQVGTEAYFSAAKFFGPVDFELARIGMRLNMNKAEFFHEKETANFLALIVDKYALFNGARFHGPVNFVIVQVGLQFWAEGAEFLSPEGSIDFRGIKTGNSIFFGKAQFMGPAKFEFSEIGANFRASGAKFLNACQAKTFAQMKVGQKLYLDEVTICCDFDLSYGDFHDVEISGVLKDQHTVQESTMNLAKLNLTGAQVQRELKIANASLGELLASYMQVKGPASFSNLEIRTLADFRRSSFQAMDFVRVAWPPLKRGLRLVLLSELTYSTISLNREKPEYIDIPNSYDDRQLRAIKEFVEETPFNTQSYVQLEAFFKRIGKEDWANRVFIRMHDRDLEEKHPWWVPARWLEWLFWGRLAGYGREPIRVFRISLALIILGAFLFNPEHLSDNPKSTGGSRYKSMLLRFFISLDRFLPIELGLAKNWDAKANRFFIWFYFHLHQILGWILIPIALASIYTQIK